MVQKKIKTIVWSEKAATQYYEILDYLLQEAPEAIEIVGNALLNTIESLAVSYNHHALDRFKKDNDNTYRAAVVLCYRISYNVENSTVNILRIRHTSREPLHY